MDYPNKQLNTKDKAKKDTPASGVVEIPFSFPHFPNPITIMAKDIDEANEKFNKIINNKN